MKHIAQLSEFLTGMDTRIGYPNEHLAKNVPSDMASPMFATSVGLVIVGSERYEKELEKVQEAEAELETSENETEKKTKKPKKEKDRTREGKKFTEVFLERIKNWFEEENE